MGIVSVLSIQQSGAMQYHVTRHALKRYRLHHPGASEQDICDFLSWGKEIDAPMALTLLGRSALKKTQSSYVLAPDRQGLFVVDTKIATKHVITYLRFGVRQSEFARKHWPFQAGSRARPGKRTNMPPKPDLSEAHPILGVPVVSVLISQRLKSEYQSNNRARVAIAKARLKKWVDQDELLLLAGETEIVVKYEYPTSDDSSKRWIADLFLEPALLSASRDAKEGASGSSP